MLFEILVFGQIRRQMIALRVRVETLGGVVHQVPLNFVRSFLLRGLVISLVFFLQQLQVLFQGIFRAIASLIWYPIPIPQKLLGPLMMGHLMRVIIL